MSSLSSSPAHWRGAPIQDPPPPRRRAQCAWAGTALVSRSWCVRHVNKSLELCFDLDLDCVVLTAELCSLSSGPELHVAHEGR